MKQKVSLILLLLFSCTRVENESTATLQKISLVDQNGFIQMISTKHELKHFQKINFLANQPYRNVTRVFLDHLGQKIMTLTAYYENGSIKEYLEAKEGRASGTYIYWYDNGNKKIEGTVAGGVADLTEKAKVSWLFHDEARAYNYNGQLEALLHYNQGKLDGKSIYYFPNGKNKRIENYQMGEMHGWQYDYYSDESLKSKKHYEKGFIDGICQENYLNGAKKNMELWIKGLLKRGHYFDPSGNFLSMVQDGAGIQTKIEDTEKIEAAFRNGRIEGKVQIFDNKGALKKYFHIKDGKKHGEERIFYIDSFTASLCPKISVNYVQDVMQGPVITWYENGSTQSQFEMLENIKHGLATGYYEDETVMYLEQYEKGKLIEGKYYKKGSTNPFSQVSNGAGIATIFDAFGNIEKQVVYEKAEALID